ncbi:HNH endonuclease [Vibrio neonatus]|uniref:HNH endonuclease n=1 Tax=Vibrio neonatus TaxID=278860 RepID=UPI0021C3F035|nr:HNH endonuclease [Vibrio neonatus]
MSLKELRQKAEKQELQAFYELMEVALECSEVVKGLSPTKRRAWLTEVLEEMLVIQASKCALCKTDIEFGSFEVDHIIPHSRGGGNERTNLQLLCKLCNRKKGSSVAPQDLLRYLESRYMNL